MDTVSVRALKVKMEEIRDMADLRDYDDGEGLISAGRDGKAGSHIIVHYVN